MSSLITHIHDYDVAHVKYRGDSTDCVLLYHTCPNLVDLTDKKIKEMDLTDLLRMQGQLEYDIERYTDLWTMSTLSSFDIVIKSGIAKDKGSLVIINTEIKFRKQSRNKDREITKLNEALTGLSLRVSELEKVIAQLKP